MSHALQRTVSKALPTPSKQLHAKPSVPAVPGLSVALARMDIDQKYVVVPSPAAPPSSSQPVRDAKSDSKSDVKSDPHNNPICPVITRSPEESRELLALYRAKQLQSGGGGGGKHKHHQWVIDVAVPSAQSTPPFAVNSVAINNTFNGRTSLQIRNHHITIRGRITWDEINPVNQTMDPQRVILFWDKMPALANVTYATAGTTAASVDFAALTSWIAAGVGTGARMNTVAPWNYNTHGFRYEVLRDEVLIPRAAMQHVNPGSSNVIQGEANFEWHVPLGDRLTQYQDMSNPLFINSNSLDFYVINSTSATASVPPECVITGDLAFTDLNDV